jgi:hypothetical protein
MDRAGARVQNFYGEVPELSACPLPNCPILVRLLRLPLAPFPNLSNPVRGQQRSTGPNRPAPR